MKRLSWTGFLFFSSVAFAQAPDVGSQVVLEDRYPKRSVAFAGGVTSYPDVVYHAPSGYRPLTLDLYLPPSPQPAIALTHPLVVHVHGGAWVGGHARHAGAFTNFPAVLASLAARGYVVASVNYRLSAEAPSPAAARDVKTAIRWLRANAEKYRIDPARVATWGGSAGGQLAGLVAVTCGVAAFEPEDLPAPLARQSDCVQAAAPWYGIFDFATLGPQGDAPPGDAPPGVKAAKPYLGCEPARCPPGLVAGASSTTYIDARDPPMLLVHGSADTLVPHQQSVQMAAALQRAGVAVELILIPGVNHHLIGARPEQTREATLQALEATFAFFDRTIGARR